MHVCWTETRKMADCSRDEVMLCKVHSLQLLAIHAYTTENLLILDTIIEVQRKVDSVCLLLTVLFLFICPCYVCIVLLRTSGMEGYKAPFPNMLKWNGMRVAFSIFM